MSFATKWAEVKALGYEHVAFVSYASNPLSRREREDQPRAGSLNWHARKWWDKLKVILQNQGITDREPFYFDRIDTRGVLDKSLASGICGSVSLVAICSQAYFVKSAHPYCAREWLGHEQVSTLRKQPEPGIIPVVIDEAAFGVDVFSQNNPSRLVAVDAQQASTGVYWYRRDAFDVRAKEILDRIELYMDRLITDQIRCDEARFVDLPNGEPFGGFRPPEPHFPRAA